MNKKKSQAGLDGMNLEYSLGLEGMDKLYLPEEELKNEVEHTVIKINCIGGKIRAYVNAVHTLRPNNIKPLGVADTIKLELVKSKVVEFIKTYLQKNLGNQYSAKYIDSLKVTQLECNLTLKCCGSATPSAVISLFDLAYDETGIRRKRKQKSEYNDWVCKNENTAKRQGLEQLPIIPLHGLRHSCATLLNYLDVNIIDISKILGHAKSSTTMDIYAHSFEKQNKEAANKLNDFLLNNRRKQA